jgi:peptide deformylase
MSLLPIITLPDPALRLVSTPVERFDSEIAQLANDMLETMYKAPGIGLAAIQVNVPKRLLVLDVSDEEEGEAKKPIVMINPKILQLGDESAVYEEGCLSLPDVRIDIERPTTLTVAYQDITGTPREVAATGLLATAIQHEIDHLDGKLIIDFLTRLKRDMIIRKFKKQARIA